jgi:hypothetical protein
MNGFELVKNDLSISKSDELAKEISNCECDAATLTNSNDSIVATGIEAFTLGLLNMQG